jgi:ribonucleoside-diphosphate reductase alpha chain
MEKSMSQLGITVKKRKGYTEPLNLEKLHKMVETACEGLSGVSASQVEMSSGVQFYNGIDTETIQQVLIKSAADLISLDNPNYQFVASRLLLFSIRKSLYGKIKDHPTFYEHIQTCVNKNVYASEILEKYTEVELNILGSYIDHHRDYLFTYAGLRQVVDKYLVQDRSTGQIYETPQFMYMMIAATGFANYPQSTRLSYVKRYYDAISKHKLNVPTPIMAGVRTPLKQSASCVLLDCGDSLDSIIATDGAMMKYIAGRAGIGLNIGRLRGIGSKIRGGEVVSTGIIPFLKKFEGSLKSCHQGGVRAAAATVYFPIWHQEIESVIVLKNNKGTDENRVRKLDYNIQFSRIFYERFINNENITLFSPNDVPGLYDSFGTDAFDALYVKYENDASIPKKVVKAQDLILDVLKERLETGRIYLMNVDHANSHSPFKDQVVMSNLCTEICEPTTPIEDLNDENGEIALCTLSAYNVGLIKSDKELEDLSDLVVRFLDELIDTQTYLVKAAEISTRNRKMLGIGIIGLAHYFAKLGVSYEEPEAWSATHGLAESIQYYLLKASNNLAKEKGACGYFNRTKYSDGILPIDTYKKDIDDICNDPLQHDWESLRQDILTYGLRHSTLTTIMPSESSSIVSNATNGIEPPRGLLSYKKSKKGPIKQIVPQYSSLKNNYTLLWDMKSNKGYFNVVAMIQKFFDQAISTNWNYNPDNFPNKEIPMSVVVNDFLSAYSLGHKTAYYSNTYDGRSDGVEDKEESKGDIQDLINELTNQEGDDYCESCTV